MNKNKIISIILLLLVIVLTIGIGLFFSYKSIKIVEGLGAGSSYHLWKEQDEAEKKK